MKFAKTNPKFFIEFAMKKILFFTLLIFSAGILYSQSWYVPELIYYRMHNNTASATMNFASSPVGTNPAPFFGETMTSGGEFDTCIQGTGNTGSNGILPGWNCSLGSGNWTISFWIKDLAEVVTNNPVYLFGDPGSNSFRCFYGGYATVNNCILRGPFTDIQMPCQMPGNYVFHIVYNGTNILIYRNGILLSTTPASVTLPTGTGFRVAGYTGGTNSLNSTGKMDEFRLYNRALNQAEITATWNHELPIIVGIISNQVPVKFELKQNYPNPFNPTTQIEYSLIKSSYVKLTVYDLTGRLLQTLVNEHQSQGTYREEFDGTNLASGTYIYKLVVSEATLSNLFEFTSTKKMILLK
jgi:hypothetical protein